VRPFLTLHHPAQARRYYEERRWRGDTFYGLLAQHAAQRPTALALLDGRRAVTWAELLGWVDAVAADLRARGLIGGDRVSIWMSNRAEAIVTLLACARQGLACNPSLHRSHTWNDIVKLLQRLSARALVMERGWGATRAPEEVASVAAAIPSLRAIYNLEGFPGAHGGDAGAPCDDPDRVVYLAFTSGTTGLPKCVMHSHNTLLANARDLVADWGHGPETVLLSLSPLSHHIAWVGVAQWLVAGCRFVCNDPPAGATALDWLIRTDASYVMGVPTHAMDMLAEQRARGLPHLGRVCVFYLAGAPIPPSLAAAFVAQGITPQNVYGMTENSSHQYTHPADATETILASCGRGGASYEVRLFDPNNRDRAVDIGELGEIGGRGPTLMLGYFDDQGATEESFNGEGWFMSGDLGRLDERGNLKVEGRLKDLIIRGGHNIYPAQIEALALRHPDVARVACFPVADARLGERVCVAISGAALAPDLLEHLGREGLSKYDMPEYFVRLAEFPLTASGKILKRELVEMVKRGKLVPEPIRYPSKKGDV
jgi:acyl-CoA synthetase